MRSGWFVCESVERHNSGTIPIRQDSGATVPGEASLAIPDPPRFTGVHHSMMSSPLQVRHIDHITLVVRDVEASRRFYVGLLGMQEVARPAFSFEGAWFQAGATLIHLIREHDRSGPAGYPVEVLVRSSRNHHFAFEVDDARAAAETLKSLGVLLLDEAKLRPDGAVQVFLTDPDLHVVELCTSPSASPK